MYALRTYQAAAALWDLAYATQIQALANNPSFTLSNALDIISQGYQWTKAEHAFQADPTNEQSHLFVTNELNTILAEVTGRPPGGFPAFSCGSNPFVQTEDGVSYVTLASEHETNHQIYAGITDKMIFIRVFAAQPNKEDFTKDVGEEQMTEPPLEAKYEYILQYGEQGQVIQARGLFETFNNDDLQEFTIKVLKNVLLAHTFNSHQAEQLQTELNRFEQTVNMHDVLTKTKQVGRGRLGYAKDKIRAAYQNYVDVISQPDLKPGHYKSNGDLEQAVKEYLDLDLEH